MTSTERYHPNINGGYCYSSLAEHLQASDRIFALLGAGLSASSSLPTYQSPDCVWRGYEPRQIATHGFFEKYPAFVWLYYQHWRHIALKSRPNPAHFALAKLADRKPQFLAITQNIDGNVAHCTFKNVASLCLTDLELDLSQRACHTPSSLVPIHGSLFDLVCTNLSCKYVDVRNFTDPIVLYPGFSFDDNLSDLTSSLPIISLEDLPHCPRCKSGLLRPNIVRFGEQLPEDAVSRIESWLSEDTKIDLMLVVGTAASVSPAADYIDAAKERGARIAVFNIADYQEQSLCLQPEDWYFQGDAAVLVPEYLKGVIGDNF